MIETVVSLIQALNNDRRRTSIEVDWKIQDRTKQVALEIVNLKDGSDVPVAESQENIARSPPLLTFEDNSDKDMKIVDLVTVFDHDSANASASTHVRARATKHLGMSHNVFVAKKLQRDWSIRK